MEFVSRSPEKILAMMISRFTISCFVAASFFLTLNDCQRTYQRSCECEKTVDGMCAYTLVLPLDNSGSNCNGGCLNPSNDSSTEINNSLNSLGRSIDSIQIWTGEQAKMMVVLQNRIASLEQHQSFGTSGNVSSDYLELQRNILEQASKLEKLERDLETVNETMSSFIAQVSTFLISSNISTWSDTTPSYRSSNTSTKSDATPSWHNFNSTEPAATPSYHISNTSAEADPTPSYRGSSTWSDTTPSYRGSSTWSDTTPSYRSSNTSTEADHTPSYRNYTINTEVDTAPSYRSSDTSAESDTTPSYRSNWSTPGSSFHPFNATNKMSNETETTSDKSLFFVTTSNIKQGTNFSDSDFTSLQASQLTFEASNNVSHIYTSRDLSNYNNDSTLVRNSTSGVEYVSHTTVIHPIYNFTLDGSNMRNTTTNRLIEATENDSVILPGSTTTLRMSWNSTNGIASDSKTSQTPPSAIQVNYTALQNFTGSFTTLPSGHNTTYLYNSSDFGNISNNDNFTAGSTSKVYQTAHSNSNIMDDTTLTSRRPQQPLNDYSSTLSTETMESQQTFPTTSASIHEANMTFNETKKSETTTTDKQTTVSQQNSTTLKNLEDHQNNSNGNDSLQWTTSLSSPTTTQHYDHYNESDQNMTTLNVASIGKWNSSEENLSATTNLEKNDNLHSSKTTGRNIFTEQYNATNQGQLATNGSITSESPSVWRMGNESSTAGQTSWKTINQSDDWNNYNQTGQQQNIFTTYPSNHISSPVTIRNNSSEHSKELPNETMSTQFPNPIVTSIFAGSDGLYTGVYLGSSQSTSNIPMLMRRKRGLVNMRSSTFDIPSGIAESLISKIADLESKLKSWEEHGRYLCSKKGLLLTSKKESNVVSKITPSLGVKKDNQTPQLNGWCIDFESIARWIQVDFTEKQRIYALMIKVKSHSKGFFYVSYGDEQVWSVYASPEGVTQIFSSSSEDSETNYYEHIEFWQPITARSIRIHPIIDKESGHGNLCFSLDILGCID